MMSGLFGDVNEDGCQVEIRKGPFVRVPRKNGARPSEFHPCCNGPLEELWKRPCVYPEDGFGLERSAFGWDEKLPA